MVKIPQNKQVKKASKAITTKKQVIAKTKPDAYALKQNEESDVDINLDAYARFAHNKKRMLQTLEKTLGVVTTACRNASVGRRTHYEWMKADPEYRKAVDSILDVALDMAESQLHKQILDGNTIATIFYLKTKGKERGYIERNEHTGRDGRDLIPFSWDTIHNDNTDTK